MSADYPLKPDYVGGLYDVIVETGPFHAVGILGSTKTRQCNGDGTIAIVNFQEAPDQIVTRRIRKIQIKNAHIEMILGC